MFGLYDTLFHLFWLNFDPFFSKKQSVQPNKTVHQMDYFVEKNQFVEKFLR